MEGWGSEREREREGDRERKRASHSVRLDALANIFQFGRK